MIPAFSTGSTWREGTCFVILGSLTHAPELCFEFLKLRIRKVLKIDEFITRVFDRANEFIQFQMNCFGVAVLSILNQKDHEKGDDCRGRVNDQLPGIGKMKSGAGNEPDEDDKHSSGKCPCAAEHDRGAAREETKCIAYDAKEIVFSLVLLQFFELNLLHNVTLASRPMRQLRASA